MNDMVREALENIQNCPHCDSCQKHFHEARAALRDIERDAVERERVAFVAGAEKYATVISDEGIWENDRHDLEAAAARRYPMPETGGKG